MLRISSWTLAIILAAVLLSGPAGAQQNANGSQGENQGQAMAVVKRMADFLSGAERFSVNADIGFDVVQDNGQKVEFGETRKMLISRPGRLRIEETKRDGSVSELVFDGETLMLNYPGDNVYAVVERPGTVDDAVSYFVDDLGMRLPLAEMLSSKLAESLAAKTLSAAFVEKASIDGVPCDHVLLRGAEADLQMWIAEGAEPLPQRVVITYYHLDGRPQFWARFSDWNMSPKVPDKLFGIAPPDGAVKIEFAAQMIQPVQ